MPTTYYDSDLYVHESRVRDRVVVVTGAASGIGKETALQFARRGAKIVVADINITGAAQTAKEIGAFGGQAIYARSDVSSWDSQVDMFDLAVKIFGSVDIVIANAGVNEIGAFFDVQTDDEGRPQRPNLKTLDINLTGVVYTTYLAVHYLRKSSSPCKAIVLLGSMASWQAVPGQPMYSAAKHGVLGLMRSLYKPLQTFNIRIAVIHPFFAETALIPAVSRKIIGEIPLTPVPRVAGAIFRASTDADMKSSGSVWLLPDDGPVFCLEREALKDGVYKLINQRSARLVDGSGNWGAPRINAGAAVSAAPATAAAALAPVPAKL